MPDEKMKYPLLEFEYDKKLYEEFLTLNPHPEFMDTVRPISEDYFHDEFGFSSDDAKKSLAHAVGILLELEKFKASHDDFDALLDDPSSELDPLVEGLMDDFRNYCTCVKSRSGSKDILYSLMEVMLSYHLHDTVYDEVKSCQEYDLDSAEANGPSPEESVFDLDKLYVKQGDRFLFLKNDIDNALRFYSLAALTWSAVPSPSSHYSLNFKGTYELYDDISHGSPYRSFNLPNFAIHYNILVHPDRAPKDKQNINSRLSSFVKITQSFLNSSPAKRLHPKRLALLMYLSLIQKYLPFELTQLRDDPDKLNFEDIALEKASLITEPPYLVLALHANLVRFASEASYDSFLSLSKAAYLSSLLLDELNAEKRGSPNRHIAYYTSSDVFSYMLPEKCTGEKKDRLGKLTVMHLSYMNDPNEGQTLRKALYGIDNHSPQKGRKELNVPYVFVKCFSPRIDYLPMWEMYGDHAKGCCLVIDWLRTKKSKQNAETILYRVCYLRRHNGDYIVFPADNDQLSSEQCSLINDQLQQLQELVRSFSTEPNSEIINMFLGFLLDKVCYLFKDSSYSYEQELRVIYQTEKNILHTDGDKPWLFVQTPFPLQLDEVILGPKFPDVSTRVPYLQEQIDQMCKKTGTEKPRITLSEIDYR